MIETQNLEGLMDRVMSAARPNVVFSPPVERNGYTVITASEVTAGGGFGFGGGSATAPRENGSTTAQDAGGSGGGGGGGSSARPVAAIVIGPDGVKVRPIVDVTKIGLAALTAWGTIAIALMRMARKAR